MSKIERRPQACEFPHRPGMGSYMSLATGIHAVEEWAARDRQSRAFRW
jgi:hypothetical protein